MNNCINLERTDLLEPNIYIYMLAEVIGNPDDDQLREAVRKAFNANEILQSKLIMDEEGKVRYDKCSNPLNVVKVTDKGWREVFKEQERIIFRLWEGELIRVFILHEADRVLLMVIAHHLAGDGKSITYFIEDVMKALSGHALEYKPVYLLKPEMLPAESSLSSKVRWVVNRYNQKWEKSGKIFSWDDYREMYDKYWESCESDVLTEHFSEKELSALHTEAKNMGVTINSYITAAFARAYRKKAFIGFAVDSRLDKNKYMSNQTTGIGIHYSYKRRKSMAWNARKIHGMIYTRLSDISRKYFVLQFLASLKPTLIDSVLMSRYGGYRNKVSEKMAKLMGYAGNPRDLSITNLTKLDIPTQYGDFGIRNLVFVPPIVTYGKNLIGIATLGNEMNITYHILKNKRAELERLFTEAIGYLKKN